MLDPAGASEVFLFQGFSMQTNQLYPKRLAGYAFMVCFSLIPLHCAHSLDSRAITENSVDATIDTAPPPHPITQVNLTGARCWNGNEPVATVAEVRCSGAENEIRYSGRLNPGVLDDDFSNGACVPSLVDDSGMPGQFTCTCESSVPVRCSAQADRSPGFVQFQQECIAKSGLLESIFLGGYTAEKSGTLCQFEYWPYGDLRVQAPAALFTLSAIIEPKPGVRPGGIGSSEADYQDTVTYMYLLNRYLEQKPPRNIRASVADGCQVIFEQLSERSQRKAIDDLCRTPDAAATMNGLRYLNVPCCAGDPNR